MSRWSWEIDEQAQKALGQSNKVLDNLDAWRIIAAARKDFALPPINLFVLDKNKKAQIAKATQHRNGDRSISATPAGMNTLTILHEIAHHFPGGFNHGAPWVWGFFTLVTWFKHEEARGRFALDTEGFD